MVPRPQGCPRQRDGQSSRQKNRTRAEWSRSQGLSRTSSKRSRRRMDRSPPVGAEPDHQSEVQDAGPAETGWSGCSSKRHASRFYQLKTGHCLTGQQRTTQLVRARIQLGHHPKTQFGDHLWWVVRYLATSWYFIHWSQQKRIISRPSYLPGSIPIGVRLPSSWCRGGLHHRYVEEPLCCSSAEGLYRRWCCSPSMLELVTRLRKIQMSSPHQLPSTKS
jgi:hypothetical protein